MNYKRFEELPCWQKARELCQAVFGVINQGEFRRDFSLRGQIWRAAGSVMDNISEGFDDGSTREFVRFLGYSQRSCSEVQSQLYRALDCNYIKQSDFDKAMRLLLIVENKSRDLGSICGITTLKIDKAIW